PGDGLLCGCYCETDPLPPGGSRFVLVSLASPRDGKQIVGTAGGDQVILIRRIRHEPDGFLQGRDCFVRGAGPQQGAAEGNEGLAAARVGGDGGREERQRRVPLALPLLRDVGGQVQAQEEVDPEVAGALLPDFAEQGDGHLVVAQPQQGVRQQL